MSSDLYMDAHRRIYIARGMARYGHLCVDCGGQAKEWSLSRTENVQYFNGQEYSDQPEDYDPRCTSCHRKFDRAGTYVRTTEHLEIHAAAMKTLFSTDEGREVQRKRGRSGMLKVIEHPDHEKRSRGQQRKCNDCPMITRAGSLVGHQKASGHSGWSLVAPGTVGPIKKEGRVIKVNVYKTVEVDDTQRKQIGALIDGGTTLRAATREEMKDWVWSQGSDWAGILSAEFGDAAPVDASGDEDLEGLDDLL